VEEIMSKKPKVNYDSQIDVLYIAIHKGKEEEFIEIAPGINVELDEDGKVCGIEILNASKFFKPVAKPLYHQLELAGFK
jgi:uncharacterized protein YuzE